MSSKEVQITCPCCESTLVIDVLTATVLKHAPKGKLDSMGKPILDEGRWQSAQGKVSERKERGKDAFDQAVNKEQSREQDLDDLFRKAKDKADRRSDDDER